MNGLLDALFGLDGLGFSDPESSLTFVRTIPAWGWALIVGGLAALVGLSYIRQQADARVRSLLAIVRVLLASLLLVLACGPELQKGNERVEEDWLVILLDRSRSMQIPDAPSAGGRITRDQQLRSALVAAADSFKKIAAEKRVLWLGFDSSAFDVSSPVDSDGVPLGPAQGRSTAIKAAIDSGLQRVAARPISGILLASDGRSADEPDRALLRLLESQRVPVFTLALGSDKALTDLAVRSVRAPDAVFADDFVTAQVELEQVGAEAPGARVELTDLATGEVLDQQDVEFSSNGRGAASLSVKLADAGTRRLGVRVRGDQEDLIAENDVIELAVEVVDRPLRALYIDGYPRWEQRYLKNLLMRERSISSSSLLLSSNRRYLQEGDVDVVQLPRSLEEWAQYDIVILGDLRPELLGQETLEQLREHVAQRGAGLVWIAGPGATPQAWRQSPLADLLPIALTGDRAIAAFEEPVTMSRTPQAEALGLFGLQLAGESGATEAGWPSVLSDPLSVWSQLRWAQRIEKSQVKPGATTLTTLSPITARRDDPTQSWPGVLLMRFGAGASVYVATDEIWRWRYGRGEDLPERFWVPLIRQLARASVARSNRSVLLTVTPEDALVGNPVRVSAELLDQSLIDMQLSGVAAEVVSADETRRPIRLDPQPHSDGRLLAGQWVPDTPGTFDVRLIDPLLADQEVTRTIRVTLPDDESRHPETNHPLLAELSERTGGRVLDVANLSNLEELLPNRELTVSGLPDVQPLWDRPVVVVILLVLLTLEWVGRRLIRLA